MSQHVEPTDLEIAALISSKICHDVIGPVGAIYNGLEILGEDDDVTSRNYALSVIRNVTEQASNRLQFARFAFGAAGSAGAVIDLSMAEQISRGALDAKKYKLAWKIAPGQMLKDKVKLLLNLVAMSEKALPRGGEIEVTVTGTHEAPAFQLRCKGTAARPPQHLAEFASGTNAPPLDPLTIQAYYTCRLAKQAGLRLEIAKDGDDIMLIAKTAAA